MTGKEKYINVADVKRKLRYIFKSYGVGGYVKEKVEAMIDNLPYNVRGNLETTLDVKTNKKSHIVISGDNCIVCGRNVKKDNDYYDLNGGTICASCMATKCKCKN